MIEYHGWITIVSNEADEINQTQIYEMMKLELKQSFKPHQECGIRRFNGTAIVWIIGAANHKRVDWADVLGFLNYVVKNAPNSYGIVHFRDDEDISTINQMQAYVIRRGMIIKEIDAFLSPIIPKIED